MDLGFFRRARSAMADRSSATLDYGMLTAALQACQSTSVTARLQAKAPEPHPNTPVPEAPIVELLIGGPEWREAVDRQGGSFNAACARNNGPRG
jgi:hypothetical protein